VFLSLSYIIDIFKKNFNANRNVVEVLLALSFFPIILAGPIQRPSSLLPQIAKSREFSYDQAMDGLKQILWGLFAKVVIADRLNFLVDNIFLNFYEYSGSTLLLGAVFFTIQIYADFSGYSNIAIGTGKLFGFNLMQNFAYPYFGRDISEFWKRWHISLTTWFRDYLFLPLSIAVSRGIKKEKVFFIKSDLFIYIISSIVTWFLTGLWHGANYTFIAWGMIHGFFLILYQWQKQPRKKLLKKIGIKNNHYLLVAIETFVTMFIIVVTWVFFRANNIKDAFIYIHEIFSKSLFTIPSIMPKFSIFSICIFFIIERSGRENQYAIAQLGIKWRKPLRYALYYVLISTIIWFSGIEQEFIYFQF
jgi:alginate O-acetyltransferase complex protein AlgI